MRLHAIGIEAPPPRFVLLASEEEADLVSARLEQMTGKGGFASQDVSAFFPACLRQRWGGVVRLDWWEEVSDLASSSNGFLLGFKVARVKGVCGVAPPRCL